MSSVINSGALCAVWRRQLGGLLGNPLGYIFILVFALIAAGALVWPDAFFTRNVCDLGFLVAWGGLPMMPVLLAVLVPALAMGAWSSERESGTEELLLTMPLSILDAVLGKFFGVLSFVTIALLCTLSSAFLLEWIGSPDWGLIFANYLGWWLAAAIFAAWSLFASTLVAMPAIAFVIGVLCSAALLTGGWYIGFFEGFNRGVLPMSTLITAGAACGLGLVLALLVLASRRWRAGREEQTFYQCASVVLTLILAINLARIGDRHGVDRDLSVDGIASLAPESVAILGHLDRPVQIAAFISQHLPEASLAKAKELEERLAAIQRYGGAMVKIERFYPKDATDEKALHARRQYGLNPRKDVVESVAGKEIEEVFLSLAISSGGRTEKIEYLDPGVHVEYELIRAIRSVGSDKKRVVGVVTTDMEMGPGFDFRTSQMRQPWSVYEEWKRQYEVRDVSLDAPVADEIETLVVPQPSSLTEAQMRNLHDYIWAGRPCLLLEDPLPMWAGPNLNAGQPKKTESNPYQQQQQPPEQKGDLKPLLRSLGIDFNLNAVVWSEYNPSHAYRGVIPKNFVWCHRTTAGGKASFADSDLTRGFSDLLFPFPGKITVASDKPKDIVVTPLISPTPSVNWGWHNFSEHVETGYGGMQPKQPTRWMASLPEDLPALAVEITGQMPSAYPKQLPNAEPPKEGEAPLEAKVGVLSAKPIRVVVVADTDFCHNLFYDFYRNASARFSQEDMRFLRDLRNVQFAGNLVDALMGEGDILAVRSRNVPLRKLTFIDEQIAIAQKIRGQQEEEANRVLEEEKEKAQSELDKQVAEIDQQVELDDQDKANLKESTRTKLQRDLEVKIDAVARQAESKVLEAKSAQRLAIDGIRWRLRIQALLIPFFLMTLLAVATFLRRVVREKSHIPAARTRSHA